MVDKNYSYIMRAFTCIYDWATIFSTLLFFCNAYRINSLYQKWNYKEICVIFLGKWRQKHDFIATLSQPCNNTSFWLELQCRKGNIAAVLVFGRSCNLGNRTLTKGQPGTNVVTRSCDTWEDKQEADTNRRTLF